MLGQARNDENFLGLKQEELEQGDDGTSSQPTSGAPGGGGGSRQPHHLVAVDLGRAA